MLNPEGACCVVMAVARPGPAVLWRVLAEDIHASPQDKGQLFFGSHHHGGRNGNKASEEGKSHVPQLATSHFSTIPGGMMGRSWEDLASMLTAWWGGRSAECSRAAVPNLFGFVEDNFSLAGVRGGGGMVSG